MLYTSVLNYFLSLCLVCTFGATFTFLITRDKRPQLMGDQIPFRSLMPNRRQIQRKIVNYHNYFRSSVIPRARNMLRMKWHNGAAQDAQRWADKCMFLTHDDATGRHVDGYGTCGQNIFVASHKVPWLFAIKIWYLEKDNFTYGNKNNDPKVVGHYVQMVWASTHEVGCGLARCFSYANVTKKAYYNYVCNYCPIGNHKNRMGRPYRKGKPCALCKDNCHKGKLCTNSCPAADLWINCKEIYRVWPGWLCDVHTAKGQLRSKSCGATCFCNGKIHD